MRNRKKKATEKERERKSERGLSLYFYSLSVFPVITVFFLVKNTVARF